MAFAEDLSVFFNPADFAEVATRTPAAGGSAEPVNVIFDAAYLTELSDMVAGTGPAVLFATPVVPGAAVKDIWLVRGITYTAAEVMPDGTGVTAVRLRQ